MTSTAPRSSLLNSTCFTTLHYFLHTPLAWLGLVLVNGVVWSYLVRPKRSNAGTTSFLLFFTSARANPPWRLVGRNRKKDGMDYHCFFLKRESNRIELSQIAGMEGRWFLLSVHHPSIHPYISIPSLNQNLKKKKRCNLQNQKSCRITYIRSTLHRSRPSPIPIPSPYSEPVTSAYLQRISHMDTPKRVAYIHTLMYA